MSQEKAALNLTMSLYDRTMDTVDTMLDLVKVLLERKEMQIYDWEAIGP